MWKLNVVRKVPWIHVKNYAIHITEFDFNKKSKHRKLNEEPFLPMMTEIPNTKQRKLARMIHDWFNQVQENNFRFNLGAYSFENLDKVMYTIEAWHLPESTELFRKSLYSKSKRSLPSWLFKFLKLFWRRWVCLESMGDFSWLY